MKISWRTILLWTIPEVETKFQLQSTENPTFFREWQERLPELSDEAKKSLDRVKSEFLYLNKYPLFEEAVKMVVLSPLLTQTRFYRPPLSHPGRSAATNCLRKRGAVGKGAH